MFEIIVVLDGVFPETMLPDTTFTVLQTIRSQISFLSASVAIFPRKLLFYLLPSSGIVIITRRELPHCVKMIRQQHDSQQIKRLSYQLQADRFMEAISTEFGCQNRSTLVGHNREEISATCHEIST